jgi:hypothetical protein
MLRGRREIYEGMQHVPDWFLSPREATHRNYLETTRLAFWTDRMIRDAS